jgi:hypothetical protein
MLSARLIALLTAGVVAVVLGVVALSGTIGDGVFDQTIIVEASQPVRRVHYCCTNIDDDLRHRLEQTADPTKYFEGEEAQRLEVNRFRARIWFMVQSGFLRGDQVSYARHLVVRVELEDGRQVCRVLDLPRGCGRDPVTVHLR